MDTEITLSIVSPTRGNFSEHWLRELCQVSGNVEFIIVYPPGAIKRPVQDDRVKSIFSPFKGEVMQRLIGLLNAHGKYVIALDDDDYIHPNIGELVKEYFQIFPESWCLRPRVQRLDFRETEAIKSPWSPIPAVQHLNSQSDEAAHDEKLIPLPIAPLQNSFDSRFLFSPSLSRKDMHGKHIENFNNKVWRTDLVQQTLADLVDTMALLGHVFWIPKWSLDRMLGLFIQAKFFKQEKSVGHWMPSSPEQIRRIDMPRNIRGEHRLIWPADALLAKRFSQYGYMWNLFFEQFWILIKSSVKGILTPFWG